MASAQAETKVGMAPEQGAETQRQRKGSGSGAGSPKSSRSSPTQQEEKQRTKSEDRTSPTGGGSKDEDKEGQGHAAGGGGGSSPVSSPQGRSSSVASPSSTSQQFCLRWNNYQTNLTTIFDQLLQNECFVDVTLACDGRSMKAHKMVLSACSPYFQTLLAETPYSELPGEY